MRCSISFSTAERARRAWGRVLLLLALCWGAPAAAARVDLYAPRAFGYFLGDTLALEAVITLDPGYGLEGSALPRPRSITYWLDLTAVTLKELQAKDGGRRYLLQLTYQSFYAPLAPQVLTIPVLPLVAVDGEARLDLTVPAFTFIASPLREITKTAGGDPMALKPDMLPEPYHLKADYFRAAIASAAALSSLLLLAALRGWGPFARRRHPFVLAARDMTRRLSREPSEDAYKEGLLLLHRAFDGAAGRRLLADDVPAFIGERPTLVAEAAGIARVFEASRIAFFGDGPGRAMALLPPADLLAIARRLAAAERAAGPMAPARPGALLEAL